MKSEENIEVDNHGFEQRAGDSKKAILEAGTAILGIYKESFEIKYK